MSIQSVSGMKNASFGLNWSTTREESIESHSHMSAGESVLSRRHEIVGRTRRWISMNENTLQCVIKTNSNMNNSLIIGESFFLLYLAHLYRFFFSRRLSDARSVSLSLSFTLQLTFETSPERKFFSFSLIFTFTIFFLYLYSLRLFLRSFWLN